MTLNEFRVTLLEKSLGRTTLPDDTKLKERVFAGLKIIAKETIPLKLLVKDPAGLDIIRRIDNELYMRYPRRPTEEDSDLDLDEELIDALGYWIMSNLERSMKKVHIADYLREIDFNNDRLMETYLSDTTNESDKMQPYV